MIPLLRSVALSALRIAVLPMAFIGFMMWAAMSGDPSVAWYVAATVGIIYAACFLFIGAVQVSTRTAREPAATRFVPARTMDAAALVLIVIVACILFAVISRIGGALGWWH